MNDTDRSPNSNGKSKARTSTWKPIAVAAAVALLVALLGGFATEIGPWYRSLNKPAFQPPDWAFGPAWTLIYAFTVVSSAKAWIAAGDRENAARIRTWIVGLFAFNIALNILWSVLFFTMRRPDWAMIEVVFFWSSIAALVWALRPISRAASWLMVPYLVWVTFASVLNIAVVQLNAPFTVR